MNHFLPCPHLRLDKLSRDTGSAVPSRVSSLIHHNQAEHCCVLAETAAIVNGTALYLQSTIARVSPVTVLVEMFRIVEVFLSSSSDGSIHRPTKK